ncbi:uncharacterized protein LOC132574809 [Heteronotia binoei]|uniref:uncharacterized protein LOC132574809 n=1 Tax=Heteronotia binoei TaxID=13085 RepID=UPI002930E30A|nr:uncharacterized protein LOC132574809 [Heteronotia binoei]
MLLAWPWLLALGLLVGRGEAQSCTQAYGVSAYEACQHFPWRWFAPGQDGGPVPTPKGLWDPTSSGHAPESAPSCTNMLPCTSATSRTQWGSTPASANGSDMLRRPESGSCPISTGMEEDKAERIPRKTLTHFCPLFSLLPSPVIPGPNLARGRPTMQVSPVASSGPGSSGCAVDGNCDGRYTSSSCTHTNLVSSPWWSVDLGREYSISLVVVKNRQDCCEERIQGATIHVGRHMGDFSKSSVSCGTIADLRAGSLSTIHCNGAVGRYVTIAIPGRVAYLTLCEVEVYGTKALSRCFIYNFDFEVAFKILCCVKLCITSKVSFLEQRVQSHRAEIVKVPTEEVTVPSRMLLAWLWLLALGLLVGRGEAQSCTQAYGGPNLARGKPTKQSTTHPHSGVSSSAVDGNCNGLRPALTCTHTTLQYRPWWSVDLGRPYAISIVVVKNRQDCCSERIQGATVYVGHRLGDFGSSTVSCGTVTDLRRGSLSSIYCNGAVGRYVTVAIPGRESILTLCEVEVYGTRTR